MRLRRTAAQWKADNPVLAPTALGQETDTLRVKFGNGITRWNSLTYDNTIFVDDSGRITATARSSAAAQAVLRKMFGSGSLVISPMPAGVLSGTGIRITTAAITGAGTSSAGRSGSIAATAARTGTGLVKVFGTGTIGITAAVAGSRTGDLSRSGSLTATAAVTGTGVTGLFRTGSLAGAVVTASGGGGSAGSARSVAAAITGAGVRGLSSFGSLTVAATHTSTRVLGIVKAGSLTVTATRTGLGSSFVTLDSTTGNLMLAGQRYRFAGNNWASIGLNEDANAYGGTTVTAPVAGRGSYPLHLSTHSEINDYLSQCVAMNAKVIRTFAAMTIGHPLSVQPTLGSFSSANLEPLDYALQQCALAGIKMVLPLTDNYEFFMGGKFDYCRLTGVTPDGEASQFFTNLAVINRFKAHINFILNHVNPYTGVAYKNDPAILAWETGNELGITTVSTNLTWTENIAAHIKAQGAQQLVMDGRNWPYESPLSFNPALMPSVDILTLHPYANAADTLVRTASQAADAKAFGKAYVWGEWPVLGYGFPRDIFGNYGAAGWTLPAALSHIEGLEADGELFWALFPSLEGHEAAFTMHSPGDNPDMVTRVNQLKAHAARLPTLITTELLSDNMVAANGTLLHNHVANSGSTWLKQSSTDGTTAGSGTFQSNRVWFGPEGSYVTSGQPPSADYDVTMPVRIVSVVNNAQVFVNGRGVSGEKTMYRALLLCFGGAYSISLWRWINGAGTQIGSAAIATPSNGTNHTLTLRMAGNQVSALWDTDPVPVVVAVDTNIRAAGHAGCGGINSSATTGMHVGPTAVTPVVDPVGMGFTPTGNAVVAMGDSITDNWSNQSYQPYLGASYLPLLSVQTKQRMRYQGIYATGSMTAQQVRTTHLPQVLALSPRPDACIIHCGTNNTGSTVDALTGQAAVKDMMAQLMAAGILPIMVTIGPHDEFPSSTPFAMAWNDWVNSYAALHNLPVLDTWTALTDPDNTYKAGYTSDGLHPTALGYAAMVNQAITDGLPNIMPANDPTVLTARTAGDLTNLINDGTTNLGMFTVDTNADGVSNGFTTSGQALLRSVTSGWSPGDRLAFGCRVQTQNITSLGVGWYLQVRLTVPGGFTYPDGGSATLVEVGAFNWLFDSDGLLYVEFVVPSGTTAIEVRATLASGTIAFSRVSPTGGDALAGSWQQLRNNANAATLRIGEMTLRVVNLIRPSTSLYPSTTLYPINS